MSGHPFNELRAAYENAQALVRITKTAEVDAVAKRLTRPSVLEQYQRVRARLGIPVVVQACICERESGSNFSRSPAQGDRWDRVSVHVPRGRGPFSSWFDSAIDAFHNVDRLDDNSAPWTMAYALWKEEGYNGFGYRAHGIRSPYLYGGTNLQQPGKYTSDGHYDARTMDSQLGCLPIALRMIELVPSLQFGPAIPAVPAPLVLPDPAPLPAAVGASLTGTKWLQDSLNKILRLADPLDVDGSFGRQTRAVVRIFQKRQALPDTGLLDAATREAIDRALAGLGAR